MATVVVPVELEFECEDCGATVTSAPISGVTDTAVCSGCEKKYRVNVGIRDAN